MQDTVFSPIDDRSQDKHLESKMCAKWCRSLECNPNGLRSSVYIYRQDNKFLAVVPWHLFIKKRSTDHNHDEYGGLAQGHEKFSYSNVEMADHSIRLTSEDLVEARLICAR